MNKKKLYTALNEEMIRLTEKAMTQEEHQALYAEMPNLLQTESNTLRNVLHKWLTCFWNPEPGSLDCANDGYFHPSLWFVPDMFTIADGYKPHGLLRVSKDRKTLGLTLKGLRVALESELQCENVMLEIFPAELIRNAVERLILICRPTVDASLAPVSCGRKRGQFVASGMETRTQKYSRFALSDSRGPGPRQRIRYGTTAPVVNIDGTESELESASFPAATPKRNVSAAWNRLRYYVIGLFSLNQSSSVKPEG